MDENSWKLFIISATNNRGVVLGYSLIEALFLGFSTLFSISLAIHFGFDVFGISSYLGRSFAEGQTIVVVAVALAGAALACRIAAGWLEASVIAHREIWAARLIRDFIAKGNVETKAAGRASNYYGRMSSASMKTASSILLIAMNLLILPFALPVAWGVALVAIIIACVAVLAWVFSGLSRVMRKASIDLVENARGIALWKMNPDLEDPESIGLYSSAYFRRIFLSSVFGYSLWLFALLFSVGILLLSAFSVEINVGEAFVAFVLAQLYLGLIGQFFNNIIKASAFAPAIEPFEDAFLNQRKT